ncbi:hypothetical protein HDU98_010882 [Podochytrium sp. JEL0797]|nr:hypothetical protein HDU98_010882 [Podochytrium sp. JEL0797]
MEQIEGPFKEIVGDLVGHLGDLVPLLYRSVETIADFKSQFDLSKAPLPLHEKKMAVWVWFWRIMESWNRRQWQDALQSISGTSIIPIEVKIKINICFTENRNNVVTMGTCHSTLSLPEEVESEEQLEFILSNTLTGGLDFNYRDLSKAHPSIDDSLPKLFDFLSEELKHAAAFALESVALGNFPQSLETFFVVDYALGYF